MQKTLYLHIGTEKTGSTALQAVSGMNRAILMKHGIFYPETPGATNHIKLTIFAADGPNILNLRRLADLFSDPRYQQFKTTFPEALRSEVAANPCPRLYLSNEHLSSRLTSVKEVNRLATIIRPLAESVKVVVYLRRQPELFLSSYSTSVKAGRVKGMELPRTGQRVRYDRYDYEKLLSLWAEVFGEANLIVRIYDRHTLVGQDVVRDFFSLMDYEPGPDIKIPSAINGRLDHDALRFLIEFNKHVPPFLRETINPDRADIAAALEAGSNGPAFAVPAAVMRDIATTYAESNARVARRFLGRSDGQLFAEVDYDEHVAGEPLTVARAVEISAHLWRWKQRELERAKREITRLKSKLESARGRDPTAQPRSR